MATTSAELRGRIDKIVSGAGAGARPARSPSARQFSSYVDDDVARATELASTLMRLAERRPGLEGLADAVVEMERAVTREAPGLVPYAVKLFMTHWPAARRLLDAPTETGETQ